MGTPRNGAPKGSLVNDWKFRMITIFESLIFICVSRFCDDRFQRPLLLPRCTWKGGDSNSNSRSKCMDVFFVIFVGLSKFRMVPDTPRSICYRFLNSRWVLNLHNHRKYEKMDFQILWNYQRPLKALRVVVTVALFFLQKNTPLRLFVRAEKTLKNCGNTDNNGNIRLLNP